MKNVTVNLSFRSDMLEKIDKAAKSESRSRSELIREATRLYIERKKRWNDIFALGDEKRECYTLKETDIVKAIQGHRRKKC
jgi:CopG family transcriptional regulator/antitoxin EndoAI